MQVPRVWLVRLYRLGFRCFLPPLQFLLYVTLSAPSLIHPEGVGSPSGRLAELAICINLPALAGAMLPVLAFWRQLGNDDTWLFGFAAILLPFVWYAVGSWIDARLGLVPCLRKPRRAWRLGVDWVLFGIAVVALGHASIGWFNAFPGEKALRAAATLWLAFIAVIAGLNIAHGAAASSQRVSTGKIVKRLVVGHAAVVLASMMFGFYAVENWTTCFKWLHAPDFVAVWYTGDSAWVLLRLSPHLPDYLTTFRQIAAATIVVETLFFLLAGTMQWTLIGLLMSKVNNALVPERAKD